MSATVFHATSVEEVAALRGEIQDAIRVRGYASVRGLYDRDRIRSRLSGILSYINTTQHRASSGVTPDEIRRNVSKWGIGVANQSQAGISRFMINIYNPLFDEDIFELHNDFRTLIALRDTVIGREVLTDESLAPDHFNACRIHFYPAGGGFMSAHRDRRGATVFGDVTGDDVAYLQLSLQLTERGVDFHSGGVYVERDGEIHDLELGGRSGDVVIWDGQSVHGVADIDPETPFNANAMSGRAVALTGVFDRGGLRPLKD